MKLRWPTLLPTAQSDPELAPYRSGLVFGFFNALTWQVAIGTPLVIFAGRLGASAFAVGLAYSFVFLLTPVQVVATALIPRFGFKRVSISGWAARCLFLAVPLWLAVRAPATPSPWMVTALVWSVFFFCLCRAVGASAMTTWFYGFLPASARGRYFANDQLLSSISGVLTLAACAALFSLLSVYRALTVEYAVATIGAVFSLFSLGRLPDVPRPAPIGVGDVLRQAPRHLFAASPYRTYLWLAVGYAVITTPIPPFAAYFLSVGPKLSAGQIMMFEVLRYAGVMSGAWVIRRRIDATGAKPFFLLALLLAAAVAVFWWFFLRSGAGGVPALLAVYFVLGLGAVCWTVGNLNYLPKVVAPRDRALLVSLQGAATSFLGGCSPVLWGLIIKHTGPDGAPGVDAAAFRWFFVGVVVVACGLSARVARIKEDNSQPAEPLVIGNALLRPFRAATYLVNLVGVPTEAEHPVPAKRRE